MKAIQSGNTFEIYNNSIKTYDQLPAGAYQVFFDKNKGFYLSIYSTIEIKEKIYGTIDSKVKKVLNSFKLFKRNLGVILSGDKGIGKSLFSKALAIEAIKQGYPLLIVNTYYPGISNFINSIEQECLILFDEFDKVFQERDGDSPQVELLTLFDGIGQGKKLFIITCNQLRCLNSFIINRPGRFHYHFRFEYPNRKEIEEYLKDHLKETYYQEIPNVVSFSDKVSLNYDCLRAIAFELNQGNPFKELIKDLNIVRMDNPSYSIVVEFDNGEKHIRKCADVDLFSIDTVETYLINPITHKRDLTCYFNPSDSHYDIATGHLIIDGKDLVIKEDDDLFDEDEPSKTEFFKKYGENIKPVRMILKRRYEKDELHYVI